MKLRGSLLLLLVVAAGACGGSEDAVREEEGTRSGSDVDESKPVLQGDGPLRGLVLATGVDGQGSVTDSRFAFTTDDTQATAVIGLGKDVPEATLTVAWFRLTGIDGREQLFSHEIAVVPGGLAYSQGVAPGGLAPGLYETVATLGELQVRTPWVVRVSPKSVTARAADRASDVVLVSTATRQRAAQGLEAWEVPEPGESGVWDDEPAESPQDAPPDTCEVNAIHPGLIPLTDVKASAWWLGPCSTLTLTATVSGPPVTLASEDGLSGVFSAVRGQADVCALPAGSDLPGTVVRFEATGSATAREDLPLPDLGESLTAGVESLPAAGSQVGPGDRIKLHAIAMVMPPAQGIEVLYVDDGNDLIESVGNVSGTEEPISCDLGRYFAQLVSEYRVPADAPPIIEICANAKGFDGTQSRDCIEFYTGEVWKGTLEVSGTFAGTVTCTSTWDGSVTFAIGEDGAITGGGTVSNPGVYRCPVPTEQPAPSTASFTVAGRAGESDLQIEFGGTQVAFGQEGFGLPPGRIRIPRSGSQASGSDSLTHAAGGATATYRHVWTLECASCGEPDG